MSHFQIHLLKSSPLVPQNVILAGGKIFKTDNLNEVVRVQIQENDLVRTQGEDSHL